MKTSVACSDTSEYLRGSVIFLQDNIRMKAEANVKIFEKVFAGKIVPTNRVTDVDSLHKWGVSIVYNKLAGA